MRRKTWWHNDFALSQRRVSGEYVCRLCQVFSVMRFATGSFQALLKALQ